MSSFLILFKGDLNRANKYKISAASVFVALLWIVILELFSVKDFSAFFPWMVFMDVTVMSIIFIGASIMFEKEEKSLITLMVTPINKMFYFFSKILTNLVLNIFAMGLIYLYALIFREINADLLLLILMLTIVSVFHSTVGFVVAMYAKEFTSFLVKTMLIFMVLALPLLFEHVGFITNQFVLDLMYILPTKSSFVLISSAITSSVDNLFALIYMISIAILGFYFGIKKFDDFLARESGVKDVY